MRARPNAPIEERAIGVLRDLDDIVLQLAPALLDEFGVRPISAATLLVCHSAGFTYRGGVRALQQHGAPAAVLGQDGTSPPQPRRLATARSATRSGKSLPVSAKVGSSGTGAYADPALSTYHVIPVIATVAPTLWKRAVAGTPAGPSYGPVVSAQRRVPPLGSAFTR